ncbi:MAG: 4Fe-4S dicluster domain-containing protein [Chloroflexi bacterium]|nr:4Fe-4S dicluster domain-containing protein [Chloroflexota bacterium]
MQLGFYFDQSRCIGCYTCVAACRSWNRLTPEMPDLIQIISQEHGEFPNVSLSHLFFTCFQCAKPTCVDACPDGLLVKRADDGLVIMTNEEQCTGCQLCVEACPYNAPQIVTNGHKTTFMKCNLCADRRAEGRPAACVAACPTYALDIGPMDELIRKYGEVRELPNFADYRKTFPAVIFRSLNVPR